MQLAAISPLQRCMSKLHRAAHVQDQEIVMLVWRAVRSRLPSFESSIDVCFLHVAEHLQVTKPFELQFKLKADGTGTWHSRSCNWRTQDRHVIGLCTP